MRTILISAACWSLAFAATAEPLTLKEVQSALSTKKARWSAADSGVAESIGVYQKKNPFGLADSAIVSEDVLEIEDFMDGENLPTALDWRNYNGMNFLSEIRSQGQCGSCVAFAAVGALEGRIKVAAKSSKMAIDLSEQYLFRNIGACDFGSISLLAAMELEGSGTTDEACTPYTMGRMGDAKEATECSDKENRISTIEGYTQLSRKAIKKALQNGPVTTAMTVYEDFMFYKSGIYEHVTGGRAGGHAVVIVGYDDASGVWIVRNSWGTSWGEEGYFRIPYKNDSGVGNGGIEFKVNDPAIEVGLENSKQFSVLSGTALIRGISYRGTILNNVHYSIHKQGQSGLADVQGTLDLDSLSAEIDTAVLEDGTYELTISTSRQDGLPTKPWFQLVQIVNGQQKISMELVPEFALDKPVKDRVYVRLNTAFEKVSLSFAEIHFRKLDGSAEKVVRTENPGSAAKIGWRTPMMPNGEYEVFAEGSLGDLQKFTSNRLVVTVQN